MDPQLVPLKEIEVVGLLRLGQDRVPQLQLDHEVDDEQELGVEEDEEPVGAPRPLLLEHAVAKDRHWVHHVEPARLHQGGKQHHDVAE